MHIERPVEDPIYDIALSENVEPPTKRAIAPMCKHSVTIIATSAGIGRAVGGLPGALGGAAVGWTLDVIRRRLLA